MILRNSSSQAENLPDINLFENVKRNSFEQSDLPDHLFNQENSNFVHKVGGKNNVETRSQRDSVASMPHGEISKIQPETLGGVTVTEGDVA